MASVNPLSRELVFKIVYYGPGLGGKTTTLEHLHATARPEHRGKLVSLATPVDRTLYFDFLPMRLPPVRGHAVRLQLFTVPGQVYFNATRKLVLTGADGVVFVSDSQTGRADANLESLENLRENLADQGRELGKVPLVFQHNKRDLAEVLPMSELDAMLNPFDAPAFASCAKRGDGVYEALERISTRVLESFQGNLGHGVGKALEASLSSIEGGLISALRDASPGPVAPAVVARISSETAAWHTMPPGNASARGTEETNGERHVDDESDGERHSGVMPASGNGIGAHLEDSAAADASGSCVEPPPAEVTPGGGIAGSETGPEAEAEEAPPPSGRYPSQAPYALGEPRQGRDLLAEAPAASPDEIFQPAAEARPLPDAPTQGDAPRAHGEPSRPARGDGIDADGDAQRVRASAGPRRSLGPRRSGVSFADLWPDAEQDTVREVEGALAARRFPRAIELCDALVSRIFASAAGLFGSAEAPRDPVLVPVLLGLDGRRYLGFRATVREARTGHLVDERAALAAYAFVIEARIARSAV
jgi:signal recognition particle receptor subunit beta